MGMDRNCRPAGHRRRRLVSVPAALVAETCERWIAGLGVALFALVYILGTISLTSWSLTIVAGVLYGVWGVAITVVTAAIAASVAFLIARSRARQGSLTAPTAADIFRDRRRSGRGRLTDRRAAAPQPLVPPNLQNYLLGVTAVSFRDFVSATLAGITPGTVLYTFIFGALGKAAANGGVSAGTLKWALFGTGLLATVVVVCLVTRKAMAKLKEAGLDDRNP